jgi:predicted amidohydrolase
MKKPLYIVYFLIATFLVYNIWSRSGRNYTYKCIYQSRIQSFGQNNKRGNLVGIQPYFTPFDFSRTSTYYGILDYHFQQAQNAGFFNDKTIVVLPEYIGTWLVVAGEKNSVFIDKEMKPAMKTVALSNVGGFLLRYLQATSADKTKEALLRMKARNMKDIYEMVFSTLAKKYRVTIVAGSIVLPGPHIESGQLRIDKKGRLYNTSCVFDPDGKIQPPLIIKQFPIEEEKTFTSCISVTTPVFQTAAGKLAVLVCSDSWYPSAYKDMTGIDMIAVPSFVSPGNAWQKKWEGYSGAPTPEDVNKKDVGQITEKEAWLKYAMCSRAPKANIHSGINVFLRGDLWDMGSDGSVLLSSNTVVFQAEQQTEHVGQIVNLWLR